MNHSEEEVARFAAARRARSLVASQQLAARVRGARCTARAVARLLVDRYGVGRVWLFGSLARRPVHQAFDIVEFNMPLI